MRRDVNHRQRTVLTKTEAPFVIRDYQTVINFCSSDYLTLTPHLDGEPPAHKCSVGSNSSPLLAGYTQESANLEKAFCEKLGYDAALVFPSGYQANLGVVSALCDQKSIILTDKYIHASLIDGIKLSGARLVRFHHNDLEDFQKQLQKAHPTLVIIESVHSMWGDITPVQEIAEICAEHSIPLYLDDAHGFGILGASGLGALDHWSLPEDKPDILVVPFGKSLGASGAIALGNEEIIETLLQKCRSYRYSTAISPLICNAVLEALHKFSSLGDKRSYLMQLVTFFNQQAEKLGLPITSCDQTPICPITVGESQRANTITSRLLEKGFLVGNLRPPSVPPNQALLRVSLTSSHTTEQIYDLLKEVKTCLS